MCFKGKSESVISSNKRKTQLIDVSPCSAETDTINNISRLTTSPISSFISHLNSEKIAKASFFLATNFLCFAWSLIKGSARDIQ